MTAERLPARAAPVFLEDADGFDQQQHAFRLFVSGSTPRSAHAIVNARHFCETHLSGRYELEVIDISLYPEVAAAEQIVAAPTLVRIRPLPRRHFIGDLSEIGRVLECLGLDGAA